MGMYWLKNQRSRAELEQENKLLKGKVLKLKLDMFVMVLEPNSKRAQKIREDNLSKAGGISNLVCTPTKGQPAEVFFR